MKHTIKATAAFIGIIAAVVILNYILKAVGCLMLYISKNCNVPL